MQYEYICTVQYTTIKLYLKSSIIVLSVDMPYPDLASLSVDTNMSMRTWPACLLICPIRTWPAFLLVCSIRTWLACLLVCPLWTWPTCLLIRECLCGLGQLVYWYEYVYEDLASLSVDLFYPDLASLSVMLTPVILCIVSGRLAMISSTCNTHTVTWLANQHGIGHSNGQPEAVTTVGYCA